MQKGRLVLAVTALVGACAWGSAAVVVAQTATPAPSERWTPGRTPWGDPNLQGTYTNRDEMGIPLERPARFAGRGVADVTRAEIEDLNRERHDEGVKAAPTFGGETGAGPVHWYEYYTARNSRPWLIVEPADGTIPPLTSEAKARAAALVDTRYGRGESDSAEDRSLYDRCISRGVPGSMMPGIYGNSYQILQGPGYVAIRYEMIHETRLIPLDGRSHVSRDIRLYMGDARGHWEGNTLVVETTNFNGKESSDIAGYGSPDRGASQNLHIVERFTPRSPTTIEWSVALNDPRTWTRAWTFSMNLTKDDSQPVFEYACHEGNYGLTNILSAARAEETR
jgi:hypothetical protein